ncbi:NF038122 family metalloprotease [Scytonema sp. NUACC21]
MKFSTSTCLKLVSVITLSFTGVLSSNLQVQAAKLSFQFASDTPQAVIDGFEKAGSIWSSKLQDKYLDPECYCNRQTNINIYINFGELSNPYALGGARPSMVQVNYQDFLTKSFRNINSANDLLAFKNLQSSSSITQNILQGLGVNTYNTDAQNRAILAQASFAIDPNKAIVEQYQEIFNQLELHHVQSLNRNSVEFGSSEFAMVVNKTSAISYENPQVLQEIDSNTFIDRNGNDNNKTIWLSSANAKALNLINDDPESGFDGQIQLSNSMLDANGTIISYSSWTQQFDDSNFTKNSIWDFSRVYSDNATVAADKFDFLTVAQHEIAHVLGVLSGTDAASILMDTTMQENSTPIQDKDLTYVTPMDLFRYSDNSKNQGIFDWSRGGGKYFSIDGGVTKLAEFDGGDYRGSHWSAAGSSLDIMHPVLKRGQTLEISELDLTLLDVMGWDLKPQSSDMSGVNLSMTTADGVLTSKVKALGLDWLGLENLLTKAAASYLSELAQERNAIALSQKSRLEAELQEQQTQLQAELDKPTNDVSKIEALKAKITNLQQQLKTLDSLENIAGELAQQADPEIVKAELNQLRAVLESQLSELQKIGDGPRRIEEEKKTLEQIANLAQKQEQAWNHVILSHEYALFQGQEEQIRQWLELSPEELKNHIANATLRQTAILLNLIDKASDSQKETWQTKLRQAMMLLKNVDETTAKQMLNAATKELTNALKNSNFEIFITRNKGGSSAGGTRYWQTMEPKYINPEQYSEIKYGPEQNIKLLNQLFDPNQEEEYSQVAVPESNTIVGFGAMGILAFISLLKKRSRMKL